MNKCLEELGILYKIKYLANYLNSALISARSVSGLFPLPVASRRADWTSGSRLKWRSSSVIALHNKKVLLRDRKRVTARGVSSCRGDPLSYPRGGVPPVLSGVPPSWPGGVTPQERTYDQIRRVLGPEATVPRPQAGPGTGLWTWTTPVKGLGGSLPPPERTLDQKLGRDLVPGAVVLPPPPPVVDIQTN